MPQSKKGVIFGIDMLVFMSKPSLFGEWFGILQRGDEVEIVAECTEDLINWMEVIFDGRQGFVRKRFVMEKCDDNS